MCYIYSWKNVQKNKIVAKEVLNMKKIAIIALTILTLIIIGIFYITNKYLKEEPEVVQTKIGIIYSFFIKILPF